MSTASVFYLYLFYIRGYELPKKAVCDPAGFLQARDVAESVCVDRCSILHCSCAGKDERVARDRRDLRCGLGSLYAEGCQSGRALLEVAFDCCAAVYCVEFVCVDSHLVEHHFCHFLILPFSFFSYFLFALHISIRRKGRGGLIFS